MVPPFQWEGVMSTVSLGMMLEEVKNKYRIMCPSFTMTGD